MRGKGLIMHLFQDEQFMSGPDPLLKAILFSANSDISPVWCVDTECGTVKTPQRDITHQSECLFIQPAPISAGAVHTLLGDALNPPKPQIMQIVRERGRETEEGGRNPDRRCYLCRCSAAPRWWIGHRLGTKVAKRATPKAFVLRPRPCCSFLARATGIL